MANSEDSITDRLQVLTTFSDPDPNLDVVLIPGVGTVTTSEWGICRSPWLPMLQQDQIRPRILEFKYDIPLDDRFSWRLFLDKGGNLLRELSRSRDNAEAQKRPLLLMCHSLGGCIAKQALCIANLQYARYDRFLEAIAGIVFLGTPHSSATEDTLAERYLWILKAANSGAWNKQFAGKKSSDTNLLTSLAVRFQDVIINLEILSVYEEKKTNFSRPFSKSKKFLLVDRDLARVGAPREQCVGVPLSHLDLCKLDDESTKPNETVKSWLETVLPISIGNIVDRTRLHESHSLPALTSDSLVSYGFIDQTLSITEESAEAESSKKGQYGSSTFDLEVIPLLQALTPARKLAKLPCISLGGYSRNKDFAGRGNELALLDDILLPSQDLIVSSEPQAPKHAILVGMAGLGKTELALEFVHSRQDKFDAIFWIHADTATKLESDFADIAVKLGLADAKEPRDFVIDREIAKGWLSKPTTLLDQTHDIVGQSEASWLIVLDNADDPDIFSDYAHIFGSGSWLITSRHPLAKTAFSRTARLLSLEPLDDETGGQLLRGLSQTLDEENLAPTVSHRLGGLPLAITQMAGYIRRKYMSLKDFLQVYQEEIERSTDSPTDSIKSLNMLDLELEQRPERARGSMASIWAIDRLNPSSKSLLEAMVFLDPDVIQDYLMKDHCSAAVTDPHFPKRLKSFFSARAALMDSSLLKSVHNDSGIRIHRVLQDAVKVQTKRDLGSLFADTVAILCHAWPSAATHKIHDVERWPRCKELYSHVDHLQREYKKWFIEGNDDSKYQYAKLLYEAGWYQHATGKSHAVRTMLQDAERIIQNCEQNRQAQDLLADIYYALGAIANETNDARSCLINTTALLKMRQQIAEKENTRDVRLAVAYNEYGIARMMLNEYDEAEKCFETAIEIYSGLPDFRKDMNTVSHANRGLAAWLKGDLPRAAKIFEEAIQDREELFGCLDKENFRCGRLWYGLGNVKYSQGEYQRSWECHQNALKQAQATVGVQHHRFADICHRVAKHLLLFSKNSHDIPEQGRMYLEQALKVIDQALGIWSAKKLVYKPELARSSFLKAKILHHKGAIEDATSLFEEAAKLRQELYRDKRKSDEHLIEEDFDELVTFWSR